LLTDGARPTEVARYLHQSGYLCSVTEHNLAREVVRYSATLPKWRPATAPKGTVLHELHESARLFRRIEQRFDALGAEYDALVSELASEPVVLSRAHMRKVRLAADVLGRLSRTATKLQDLLWTSTRIKERLGWTPGMSRRTTHPIRRRVVIHDPEGTHHGLELFSYLAPALDGFYPCAKHDEGTGLVYGKILTLYGEEKTDWFQVSTDALRRPVEVEIALSENCEPLFIWTKDGASWGRRFDHFGRATSESFFVTVIESEMPPRPWLVPDDRFVLFRQRAADAK